MFDLKKIVIAVCAVVLVVTACVGVSQIGRDRQKKSPIRQTQDATEASRNTDDTVNVLLLGTDREAGLCDVMMLVNVNFTDGAATVLQIPRDTYASYTDSSYKKLNGAYSRLGGADKVAELLEGAMGIEIHHYACIGLDTMADIVDAVGGVDVDLPCDMSYRDAAQGLYIDLKKGMTHLDGSLAEQFVRFRSGYIQGDLGRLDAQKLFMAAFIRKIASEFSPTLALKLATAIDGIETDLSVSEIMTLGARALNIRKASIALLTLPGEEVTARESGASYYVISRPAAEKITSDCFGRTSEFDPDKMFLNTRYKDFKTAYEREAEYAPLYAADVSENGINIQIKG